jgi:hypothetical protein
MKAKIKMQKTNPSSSPNIISRMPIIVTTTRTKPLFALHAFENKYKYIKATQKI